MRKPITVGRFGRTFGIHGWVYVISFTDPKENILSYQSGWGLNKFKKGEEYQRLVLIEYQYSEKGIRVKLEGYDTPEEAQCLVNKEIVVPREVLPALMPDQYYWSELEGLLVKNMQGVILGQVEYLFETGSNDVMIVKNVQQEHWIPFLPSVVLEVNLQEKWILVMWDAEFNAY